MPTLKEQLQKTQKEFENHNGADFYHDAEWFIKKAQIEAVKAFAEEIKYIKTKTFPRGERLWCIKCANRIYKEINNLLKDY